VIENLGVLDWLSVTQAHPNKPSIENSVFQATNNLGEYSKA